MNNKPASSGKYAGTGLSYDGKATLERTSSHEIGHSANLDHIKITDLSNSGNLMSQSIDPKAGQNLSPNQFSQMKIDYKNGKLNQGGQVIRAGF